MNQLCCGSVVLTIALLSSGANFLNADDDIATLIDQLANVDTPDTGYAQFFSGTNFLPYEDTEKLGTLIIGATGRKRSPVMRKLVEAGFDAVPVLLAHLSDERKVKLPAIESGGFMWIAFSNEYDFNRTTVKVEPEGVNIESFKDREGPSRHEVTVGDLCFVALGQIVNRHWSASRYQPTGGRIINSPTYSKELRKAINDEWGKLNRVRHRSKLIEDFRKPDSEYRIIGAYHRLSFYYPEEVEALVLGLLSRQIPDGQNSYKFMNELAKITNAAKRKTRLNKILSEHGQHYRDAIQDQFFSQITSADVRERNGIELDDDELASRTILHETFGWAKPVRYSDWRRRPKNIFDNYEMARIIKSLTHDDSVAIGKAVQAIMESNRFKADTYMVEACLTCLASRKVRQTATPKRDARAAVRRTYGVHRVGSPEVEAKASPKKEIELRNQRPQSD